MLELKVTEKSPNEDLLNAINTFYKKIINGENKILTENNEALNLRVKTLNNL